MQSLTLRPYPSLQQGQAYNSADTLLVEAASSGEFSCASTLVVNDEFGALCAALAPEALWTDSYLAKISLQKNLALNNLAPVDVLWSIDRPLAKHAVVVMRVPKQTSYFEHQLSILAEILTPGTHVLCAGMDKHLPPGTAQLLETYIGPTLRHRGQRKARLFSAQRDNRPATHYSGASSYPDKTLGGELMSLANVFARDKVDKGSHFLLEHMGKLDAVDTVFDLACGNGILGLRAASIGLAKKLHLFDESAMAIASAQDNAGRLLPKHEIAFHHGDGLLEYTGAPAQLILCNPPFHHNHRVDETVGRRLLVQASRHLEKNACLCLIANRHLNYLPVLKREFSRVEKLAQNSKFIIWLAYR